MPLPVVSSSSVGLQARQRPARRGTQANWPSCSPRSAATSRCAAEERRARREEMEEGQGGAEEGQGRREGAPWMALCVNTALLPAPWTPASTHRVTYDTSHPVTQRVGQKLDWAIFQFTSYNFICLSYKKQQFHLFHSVTIMVPLRLFFM